MMNLWSYPQTWEFIKRCTGTTVINVAVVVSLGKSAVLHIAHDKLCQIAIGQNFNEVESVMVRVRLKRTGTRNAACFRIVVMDQRSSRDGSAIEELGFYNPRSKEEKIDIARIDYWISVGASLSKTVEAIVKRVREGKSLKDIVRKPSISKKAKAKLEAEAKAKTEATEATAEQA